MKRRASDTPDVETGPPGSTQLQASPGKRARETPAEAAISCSSAQSWLAEDAPRPPPPRSTRVARVSATGKRPVWRDYGSLNLYPEIKQAADFEGKASSTKPVRPARDLSAEERTEVAKAVREFYGALKGLNVVKIGDLEPVLEALRAFGRGCQCVGPPATLLAEIWREPGRAPAGLGRMVAFLADHARAPRASTIGDINRFFQDLAVFAAWFSREYASLGATAGSVDLTRASSWAFLRIGYSSGSSSG